MVDHQSEKRNDQRVPSPPQADIQVTIQGVTCTLCNISDCGLGIQIDTPSGYHLGQRIKEISITVDGHQQYVCGSVAHITRTLTGYILGIRLEIGSIQEYQVLADLKKNWSR